MRATTQLSRGSVGLLRRRTAHASDAGVTCTRSCFTSDMVSLRTMCLARRLSAVSVAPWVGTSSRSCAAKHARRSSKHSAPVRVLCRGACRLPYLIDERVDAVSALLLDGTVVHLTRLAASDSIASACRPVPYSARARGGAACSWLSAPRAHKRRALRNRRLAPAAGDVSAVRERRSLRTEPAADRRLVCTICPHVHVRSVPSRGARDNPNNFKPRTATAGCPGHSRSPPAGEEQPDARHGAAPVATSDSTSIPARSSN